MTDQIPPGTDLTSIGLKPNPNGQPPNLVDPPSQAPLILGSGIALIAISSTAVGMRLATNFRFTKKLGIDDYLCLFAEIVMIGYVVMCISLRDVYKHSYDVPLSMLTEEYAKKSFVLNLIVGPAFWASKTAVLALYLRLFSVENTIRYTSYAAIVVLFFIYWSLVPVAVVACTPRNGKPWISALQKCSDQTKVHGPLQGACVFATGILAIVASAIALYYRVQIWRDWDTWRIAPMYTAAFFECFITIIVSCAPALYSFWSNYLVHSSLYNSFRSGFSTKSTGLSSTNKTDKSSGAGISASYHRFGPSSGSIHSSSKQPILGVTETERSIPLRPLQKCHKSVTKTTMIEQTVE
ncbi:hypothetical protein K469DRAFT_696348 [Zopfia rhizophila CBS 207.26]|uniref:Rhodopsin domain-containing protein n=1 Tax=Zopfia rhizophila CBS 207.26 TaxID=1314779 RepID=A0A6A6DJQ1_9PEZI|nr:hypothetical protein K469DRAFT_696348 [Zopfia rhizophila CBS 207.26]